MAKIAALLLLLFSVQGVEPTWVLFQTENPSLEATPGLAIRLPPLQPETLEELTQIGIHFTFAPPPVSISNLSSPQSPDRGLFFFTDFNQSAPLFLKWLEFATLRPSQIVIVDAQGHLPVDLKQAIENLHIPCELLN